MAAIVGADGAREVDAADIEAAQEAQLLESAPERLRADAPPWVSQLLGPTVTTVPGETVPGPGEARRPGERTRPSSSARMTIPGEAVDASAAPTTPKDPNA